MLVEEGSRKQKLKYPKSVFFIISNEFCERFSFYGMRTILVQYLRNKLNYNDDTSTVIYHAFTMLVYFFPAIGAVVADSILGKFRTIFYLSVVYAIGQLLLSGSAAPPIGLPSREFSILGLVLIAVGSGGIKPCVAAFGGDQFVLPQQERYLAMFFSLFYFSINSGSLISTFVTPILRSDVPCFNETTCYSLAFLVPAVLMIVSIVIFILGRPLYTIKEPTGNVVVNVSKCISHAICRKIKSRKVKRDHWLDHADDEYDKKLIEDTKAALQVLKLMIPLPIFWALYDQQGSRWTIQATKMRGDLGSYTLEPDQMQVVNPLLILIFIPLFETCIYPIIAKIRINTPLRKLTTGGILAGVSFIVSALVELELQKTYPVLPSEGLAQVRIFNTLNCEVPMTVGNETFTLGGLAVWEKKNIEAKGSVDVKYQANFAKCSYLRYSDLPGDISGVITGTEATATSFAITRTGLSHVYVDSVAKTTSGKPAVRGLIYIDDSYVNRSSVSLKFVDNSKVGLELAVNSTFRETELTELGQANYDLYLDNELVQTSVPIKLGGIYTIVGYMSNSTIAANVVTVTAANSMHMAWLLPQYIIITMGEVMFSVTGLEFAFTQAPISMKSLMQAGWCLTVAFGNLIVVIVAEASFFSSQASEFFLFAGLTFAIMLIFGVMATFYKYVEVPDDESQNGDIALESKSGTVNASFKEDD